MFVFTLSSLNESTKQQETLLYVNEQTNLPDTIPLGCRMKVNVVSRSMIYPLAKTRGRTKHTSCHKPEVFKLFKTRNTF